ncbi:hypothetical protein L6164_018324 [Bauhinia variegata]|uniref:Uncharacterized protein n=1 Tax=Bauhinia variegata TaxID=167791 RepID=A0ACB9NBK4_BAUVA|nr:hypothetical protein L6164_018324 [Bauhinia variegata]
MKTMEDHLLCLDLKKAKEEITRGCESAHELLEIVHKWNCDKGSTTPPFAVDLVRKILRSFTDTLMLLNTSKHEAEEVSDVKVILNSEDLEERCKSLITKNRRGTYKRKRTIQAWEKDTPTLIDDGYAWRKYGQKMTVNAKYLRNYYRCTHKYEQGCQAIKQVQRIQEKPPLHRTTYYGHHTCNNLLNPEMILEPSSPNSDPNSILISFNDTVQCKKVLPPIKRKAKEEMLDHHHMAIDQSLSSSYPEVIFDSSNHVTAVLSSTATMESNCEDLISRVMIESFEIDHVFDSFGF